MENQEYNELKENIEKLHEEQQSLLEENKELKAQNEALRKQADLVVEQTKRDCKAMELAAEKNICDKWIVFQKKLNAVLKEHKAELDILSEKLPEESH